MRPSAIAFARFASAFFLAATAAFSAGGPWDKAPGKWSEADAYRILRDSPWAPTDVKVEAVYTQRHTDALTHVVTDGPANPFNTDVVRGVEVSRSKPLPDVSVVWWSSKVLRLAQLRLRQLRSSSAADSLRVEEFPDFVVAIQGSEAQRILRDAQEDLHDTVFLELPDGFSLDFDKITYFEGTDDEDPRTEFHFPRTVNGHASIDPSMEKVILHCRATAKKPMTGRDNDISIRVEFHPGAMRFQGAPDL